MKLAFSGLGDFCGGIRLEEFVILMMVGICGPWSGVVENYMEGYLGARATVEEVSAQ